MNEAFPLHRASREGFFDVLEVLISKHGLNPNSQTFDMVTALHEASAWGHAECVKLLIKLDASINARNIDGSTPICEASSYGRKECIRILLDAGAFVNPPLLLSSPLHEAVFNDNWECAEMLIEAGAELHASDIHFGTPLHVASLKGYYKSAEVLLRAGANVNAAKMHHTALHEALKQGWGTDFLQLLLEHGANVNYINNQGFTSKDLVPKHSKTWDLLTYWENDVSSVSPIESEKGRKSLKWHGILSTTIDCKIIIPVTLPALNLDVPWFLGDFTQTISPTCIHHFLCVIHWMQPACILNYRASRFNDTLVAREPICSFLCRSHTSLLK